MDVHAAVGSPPIRTALQLIERPRCVPGTRTTGRPSSGFAYLGTRPDGDPVGRLPEWADDLPVGGLFVAARPGVAVTLNARDAPNLWIEARGLC